MEVVLGKGPNTLTTHTLPFLPMSIVTVNRAIIPALWPNGLGRVETSGFDLQVKESWRYVPERLDDFCDWADVVEAGGRRDNRYFIYAPNLMAEEDRDTQCVVTVVLQGFLGKHAVSLLGNWKG